MAMQDRTAAASLIERLAEEGHRYSFFQLVQLLLRADPGAMPPGGEGPAAKETIRFRPAAGLGFAPADLETIEARKTGEEETPIRYRVTVNFMGLYGPASPMPNHFAEEILWAGTDGETLRDFLDLFHHRLISFVYRAWEKYRHYVQFEAEGPDRFTRRILCLLGLGTAGMLDALSSPHLPLMRVAGLVNSRPHSAVGLEGLLRDHFEPMSIRIESFTERTVRIPDEQTARLGRRACRLGSELCLGERIQDCAGGFRVSLGPLAAEEFRRFLPGRDSFDRLVRTVRFYAGDSLGFDLRILLDAGEVPALALSPEAGLPLGQMSWLHPVDGMTGETILATKGHDPLTQGAAGRPQAPEIRPAGR